MTALPSHCLHRKNVIARSLLGDRLFINRGALSRSEPCKKFIKAIRSRQYIIRGGVSSRVISHWESQDLLECERKNESGWRKFNLIEYVWFRIVQKLRELGLPISKIGRVKAFYFEFSEKVMSIADYYFVAARLLRQPVFFVILLNDDQAEFFDYYELQAAQELHLLGNYISINLNDILNQIFTYKVEPKYPFMRSVSPNLSEALDVLEEEDYDTAIIHKKGKNIQKVELNKHCDNKLSDHSILEDHDNVDLIKKRRNGKIVSKKRTVIKTIKE